MEPTTVLALLAAAAGGGVALYRKLSPSYQEKMRKQEEKRKRQEEERKRQEEERRRQEEQRASQRHDQQWEEVNHSPWWIWGIPEKANLVLDAQLLYDKSATMAFWFKMVQDNAEDRDWNVVLLRSGYEYIMRTASCRSSCRYEYVVERLDHLQRFLGSRFRILQEPERHNKGQQNELANYLLAEKTRPDVFFVSSLEHKVALVDLAQRNGVELQHEIRTPGNRLEHLNIWSFKGNSQRSAYPDASVDKCPPNFPFHACDPYGKDVLKRFVEWKVIKLDIQD